MRSTFTYEQKKRNNDSKREFLKSRTSLKLRDIDRKRKQSERREYLDSDQNKSPRKDRITLTATKTNEQLEGIKEAVFTGSVFKPT